MRSFGKYRLVSVGSVPPSWGGASAGGVATFHQAFIEEVRRHRVDLAGVLPLNLRQGAEAPSNVPYLWPEDDERQWYVDTIAKLRPDVVKFFHIGHRWARWHVDSTTVPAVGSVRSWHQLTQRSQPESERARQVIEKVLCGIAALIFPSEHTRREGEQLGLTYRCPTYVIPNHQPPDIAAAPLRNVSRRGIVFVGSLIPRKRVDLVIRAGAALGMPVRIIGDGPERSRLESLAEELGSTVKFLGERSVNEVTAAYQAAEVLCAPSASESFGNVYLEAAACGTPSVGFAPTLAEISEHLEYPLGEGIAGDATEYEVAQAVGSVVSRHWDRRQLQERAETLSPRRIVGRYMQVMRIVSHPRAISLGR